MSAPQTNIERQKRRHAVPILGTITVVVFALALFFAYTTFVSVEGQTLGEAAPLTEQGITAPVAAD